MLTYHGLDAERFPPPGPGAGPDGSDPARPVELLGVARLVPKKGLEVLLEALAALPAGLHWRYEHVGGGPLRQQLEAQSGARSASPARIDLARRAGAATQVLDAYRRARSVRAARAGSPPTATATACRTCCSRRAPWSSPAVASRIAAIPELIEDGVNGLLVPPDDPPALAAALARLIARSGAAPAARPRGARPGARASSRMSRGIDRLAARLRGHARAGPAVRGMRRPVAFYAPLKPPDHPTPSGDRRMARALLQALERTGAAVELASRLRSYDRAGDPVRQRRHRALGEPAGGAPAAPLPRAPPERRPRPGSPITPITSRPTGWARASRTRSASPICIAEASFAPKQAGGPLGAGHVATRARDPRARTWCWR